MPSKKEELIVKEQEAMTTQVEAPMGFEDDDADDMIIPRVKIIQTLSPECRAKEADEGDIINSLTKDKLNDAVFVPVFKFNNNIDWRDRADGGGIKCIARDGKVGEASDGSTILCASCKRCEFDNTKQGKEAAPKCTKYINFFGFIEGNRMPIILSFAKTSFNEGKKMYSLAKVTMQNMWNHGYKLVAKHQAKGGNEWFIISPVPSGQTSQEDRDFGLSMYKTYRASIQNVAYDMDDSTTEASATPNIDIEKTEY